MDTNFRKQKVNINKELFTHSSKFSFVQAIRLLKKNFNNKDNVLEQKIRTHPRLSLAFPKSDIVDITMDKEFIRLTVTFMGLYGESSPLPTFYTEELLEEERNDKSVMRDFIDIFNTPLYQMYFKVWLKNQLGIRLNEFNDTKILDLLHTFSGMPYENLRQQYEGVYSFLRYAGLNMHYPRSAEALRTLICDIIKNDKVEVVQCVKQTAKIPSSQYCSLGEKNTTLDDNLHLGNKIKDRMGKFRILISELDMESFNVLLPGAKKFKALVDAVKLYIGESLSWDLQLKLKDSEHQEISLGTTQESKLGLNTWLGRDNKLRTLCINTNQ